VPEPNKANCVIVNFPSEARNSPFSLFMNAAFLDTTCRFLWIQLNNLDRDFIRTKVIPFVYGNDHDAVLADYNAIPNDARMNIYHTVMFLGTSMRWHPDDEVRRVLESKFAERGIGVHTLRATLVHFVKRCLNDSNEPIPSSRIQLGRRLDEVFRNGRFHQADEAKAVYDRWPRDPVGHRPIAQVAGIAENTGSLEDHRVEAAYQINAAAGYDWNDLPEINAGSEVNISEPIVLDSFLYAAQMRMMTTGDGEAARGYWPDFWPVLKTKDSDEAVEYVIVRPCIEHNMLGIIMGRGGGDELGNTLWGQTELSCECCFAVLLSCPWSNSTHRLRRLVPWSLGHELQGMCMCVWFCILRCKLTLCDCSIIQELWYSIPRT
jgi:hypothetical protein